MVPAPTQAPTLMKAGGMMTTPGATWQPSRTELPPGTIRTPSPSPIERTGQVSLSK